MTLSNAAWENRDVQISTSNDSVRITDAFEVLGGDWDLSEVAISLAFNVVRVLDPLHLSRIRTNYSNSHVLYSLKSSLWRWWNGSTPAWSTTL